MGPREGLNDLRNERRKQMDGLEITPRTLAIGVGGAGCEVINRIYSLMPMVDTVAVNCDKEAMHRTNADVKLYICRSVTNGEGAKGDVGLGRDCAKAHIDDIEKAMTGYDATPVIAEKARSMGIMTFVIAINPFSFEGRRVQVAKEGIAKIRQVCASTVVVENDLMVQRMPDATMKAAMETVNRSIASFIGKKITLIKECFESEFESISSDVIEQRLAGGSSDLTDPVGSRPKTAKE